MGLPCLKNEMTITQAILSVRAMLFNHHLMGALSDSYANISLPLANERARLV